MGLDIVKYKIVSEEEHETLDENIRDSVIVKEYEVLDDDLLNLLNHFKDKVVQIKQDVLGETLTFYVLPLKKADYQPKGMGNGYGELLNGRFVYSNNILDNIKQYCKDGYPLKDWSLSEDEFIWFCN